MLRAGLHTELASCLANRKRKLSELFAYTVGFTAEVDPKYRQQEAQFLDANDLEKNRYFSISTLPSRPNYVSPTTKDQSLQTDVQPAAFLPDAAEDIDERSRAAEEAASKQSTIEHDEADLQEQEQPTTVDSRTGVGGNLGQRPGIFSRAEIGSSEETKQDGGDRMDVEVLPQDVLERRRIESVVESPRGSPGIDPVRTTIDSKQTSSAIRQTAHAGSHTEVEDVVMGEAHSSPASSNEVASSLPEAVAGSPTTSPSEDINSAVDAMDAEFPVTTVQSTPKARPENLHSAAQQNIQQRSGQPQLRPSSPTTSKSEPDGKRPTMRIDTGTGQDQSSKKTMMESPATILSSATPRRLTSTASAMPSPPERMTTRVSSGAIRHKSVSEILGETPKSTSPSNEKGQGDKTSADSSRAASVAVSAGSGSGRNTPDALVQARQVERREKDKERSRLSTVVFAKQQLVDKMDSTELLQKVAGEVTQLNAHDRDYLWTLFESRAHTPPRSLPLSTLLQSAHKTLTTSDHLVEYQEQMNCRTLKRIYQLQNANRWPLRQMQRAAEPPRATSHWDFVLDHMKWLRTDFREERKWKLAAARGVAEWCFEWFSADAQQRIALQVRVRPARILPKPKEEGNVQMEDQRTEGESTHTTPDLVASNEDESVSDEIAEDLRELRFANTPAAIFSLGPSEFSFPINKTAAAEKLLNELPLYQPARVQPDLTQSNLAEKMDARWKKDILPISRYATGKVKFVSNKPSKKRSRYDYESDDADSKDAMALPPEQTSVGLFMPENKHIRDRIHPGHQFRPPTEHPMPTQAFFEARTSSQWTHVEDDELRKLVKDYSYNWSLISSCLSPKSLYHSGAERRTPWECFERWIGLEGLPADMSKTPYFRAYHSRIEAAGRHILAQQQAAQQQAANGNIQIAPRKRTTQPIRVERRRTSKHLAMLDAMRKLAKKRETTLQKQQHAAGLAAMRRSNESAKQPSKPPISTPAQFSQLKHEREVKAAEKAELYRQQVLAHQKAAMQHRNAQAAQPNGVPNGVTRPTNGLPMAASPNGGPGNLAVPTGPNGQVLPQNQQRAQQQVQGLPNGASPNGALPATMMNMKGLPPGQIPQNMVARGLPNNSPESMRVLYEANRVQAEQQRYLAQRQQQAQLAQQQGMQSQPGPHSSPNMSMASVNGAPNNAAMLAALQAAGGIPSPSMLNGTNGTAGSPRNNGGQPLSSGMVPAISQIASSIQARNPELPPEEVQRRATHQLNKFQQQQQIQQRTMNQAALNAAAGAANAANATYNAAGQRQGMMTNEQVQAYNQIMRQQQAAQRAHGGPAQMMAASPVMNGARPGTANGQNQSRSATPRDQRSGSQSLPMNGQSASAQSPSMQ